MLAIKVSHCPFDCRHRVIFWSVPILEDGGPCGRANWPTASNELCVASSGVSACVRCIELGSVIHAANAAHIKEVLYDIKRHAELWIILTREVFSRQHLRQRKVDVGGLVAVVHLASKRYASNQVRTQLSRWYCIVAILRSTAVQ